LGRAPAGAPQRAPRRGPDDAGPPQGDRGGQDRHLRPGRPGVDHPDGRRDHRRDEVVILLLALLLQDAPDLSSVPADLQTPAMTEGEPAAGRRVKQTTPGWEGTAVHHALYLPRDWKAEVRYPVIVEYAGNGNYKNSFGDVSKGTV